MKLCLVAVIVALNTLSAFAQSSASRKHTEDERIFLIVPEENRTRLRERLDQFMKLQQKQEWAQQYEMLAPTEKPSSVNAYVKAMKAWNGRPNPARFEPRFVSTEMYVGRSGAVNTANKGVWMITGCGATGRGPFTEKHAYGIDAWLIDGEWFFSTLQHQFTSIHGSFAPCEKK